MIFIFGRENRSVFQEQLNELRRIRKLLDKKDVTVTSRVNGKLRKRYRTPRKGRQDVEDIIERLACLLRKVFR